MEGLRRRAIHIVILLVAAGVVVRVTPSVSPQVYRQDYYAERVPRDFGRYVFRRNPDMGEAVWTALKPDGLVWHIYDSPDAPWLDFVLLAGRTADSFHDPQLCFRNQGWQLLSSERISMKIDSLGRSIDVNLLRMKSDSGSDATSVYFFISPLGYTASPLNVKLSLFAAKTTGVSMGQGYFLRFIVPSSGDLDQDLEVLRKFISAMMTELHRTMPEAIPT